MPNITTCSRCGTAYEAGSEEQANDPARLCRECVTELVVRPLPPCRLCGHQAEVCELVRRYVRCSHARCRLSRIEMTTGDWRRLHGRNAAGVGVDTAKPGEDRSVAVEITR